MIEINQSIIDAVTAHAEQDYPHECGGMLIGISSPYAQRGLLFSKHRDCFGKDDAKVLVVQAGTKTFNPTIDVSVTSARRSEPASTKHLQTRANIAYADAKLSYWQTRSRGSRR